MCRFTFEQSLKNTLANSRLSRIVDGERTSAWWHHDFLEDKKDVENLITKLCKDLSKIMGRPVQCFTKLKANEPFAFFLLLDDFKYAKWAYEFLNEQIIQYIKEIMDNVRPDPPKGLILYPISKIRWEKWTASARLPNSMGVLKRIKLKEPIALNCNVILDKPPHIIKLLKICKETYFDYQPYFLTDDRNSILALKLGCEWNDLAIAVVKPLSRIRTVTNSLILLSAFCFVIMIIGLWYSSNFESWMSIFVLVFSILFGTFGGCLIMVQMARIFKPLKI